MDKIKQILRALIDDNKRKKRQIAFYQSQQQYLSEDQISNIKALNDEAESLLKSLNED